jgi:predicted dithiol-disulfide oxidoreductase (DUF899 family)
VISFNETYSTPSEVKTAYESNTNTNVFTDSEKSKLSGIETGAEVNDVEEAPINGNQYARQDGGWTTLNIPEGYTSTDFNTDFNSKSTDDLSEGTTNLYYTDARASNAAPVQSVAGKTGNVSLTSSDVGLGSVRNVSSYSQAETNSLLNGKLDTTAKAADSDKLDGIDSTQFLRSDSNDSHTRKVTFQTGDNGTFESNSVAGGGSGPLTRGLEIIASNSNDAMMTFHVSGNYALHFGLDSSTRDLAVGGWSMGSNVYRVWHSGNDGPGSGLDADTIDGYQAQDFAYPNQPQIANITLTGDFA